MRSLVSITAFGAFGLLALGACADGGDESLFITENVAVSTATGTGCTFTSSQGELFLSHGFVDVDSQGYLMHPQVTSRISADTADDPTAESQRTVILTDATIDITFPDTTLFSPTELTDMNTTGLTHFKELVSAPVAPNGGITDVEIEVIHRPLIDAVEAKMPAMGVEMQVAVQVHGTMSGADESSQTFSFPVTLGNLKVDGGPCPLPSSTMIMDNPCNPFQDDSLLCCEGSGGSANLTCPAEISST